MYYLLVKVHKLCIISKENLERHLTQSVGSYILDLSTIDVSLCPHTVHLKYAAFISGYISEHLITIPLTDNKWLISVGFRSLTLVEFFRFITLIYIRENVSLFYCVNTSFGSKNFSL